MSSTNPAAVAAEVAAERAEDENENVTVDSAEADRMASKGEDTSTVEQQDGENETSSADADYEASMGKDSETD